MRLAAGRSVDRSLLVILGFVLALVAATLVAALTLTAGRVVEYPAGTPERAVQEYVVAISAGDLDAAYALLAADYRRRVTRDEFADSYRYLGDALDDTRIAVERTEVEGDRATVTLTVTSVYADDFSYDVDDREQQVTLVREEGQWRLVEPPYLY